MARHHFKIGFALLALVSAAACTVKEQKTPELTGPSGAGISMQVQVTPDTIFQEGASQALVTVTVFDSNGQPLRSLPLRAEIVVDDTITDFGTLSARNVVTDANGKATLTYTAPPPVQGVASQQIVSILFRPTGTNFDN